MSPRTIVVSFCLQIRVAQATRCFELHASLFSSLSVSVRLTACSFLYPIPAPPQKMRTSQQKRAALRGRKKPIFFPKPKIPRVLAIRVGAAQS